MEHLFTEVLALTIPYAVRVLPDTFNEQAE